MTVSFKEFLNEQDNLGAGALIIARDTGRVLLGLRSKQENHPGVWGNQGGHIDSGETVIQGLKREVREEAGYKGPIDLIQFPTGKFKEGEFMFYNFLGLVPKEFTPKPMKKFAWEHDKFGWFDFDNLPKPMHPIMMKDIRKVKNFITTIINQIRST